jgi:hypothetical protein
MGILTLIENCLFRRFRPFVAFEVIQLKVRLRINTREKCVFYMGRQ